MRMAGVRRVDTVPGMGNDRASQLVEQLSRIVIVVSFPLRVLFHAPEAPERESAAAVHHYGART